MTYRLLLLALTVWSNAPAAGNPEAANLDIPPASMAKAASFKVVFKKAVDGFINPEANAVFVVPDSTDAVDVYGMISVPNGPPVFLSNYPVAHPPGSHDFVQAEIADAFVAEAGQGLGKYLFVISRWRLQNQEGGVDGYDYRVFAYPDKVVKGAGDFPSALVDDSLGRVFGRGFDGQLDGKAKVFKYKTAKSILERLGASAATASDRDQACCRKVAGSYRAKALDLGCALEFAHGPALETAAITPKNVAVYNDLGFFLGEGAKFKESARVLEKVVTTVPGRTVAYLNLADAYWGLSDTLRARPAYGKYCRLMKSEGKSTKIPKRALDRKPKE